MRNILGRSSDQSLYPASFYDFFEQYANANWRTLFSPLSKAQAQQAGLAGLSRLCIFFDPNVYHPRLEMPSYALPRWQATPCGKGQGQLHLRLAAYAFEDAWRWHAVFTSIHPPQLHRLRERASLRA